jgi:hypothetical protein
VAERCSVQRGSGSGGSGTQQSNDRGRTLQRAAGQRQQWKRLLHLLCVLVVNDDDEQRQTNNNNERRL